MHDCVKSSRWSVIWMGDELLAVLVAVSHVRCIYDTRVYK